MRYLAFMLVWLVVCAASAPADTLRFNYEGFTIWLDCDRRGAVKFRYNAQRDQGKLPRHSSFSLDPNVPARCQQTSTASYKHPTQRYDRGHLVPANHLDHSRTAIKQSNFMTNILPQAATMNRGTWLQTEEIIEYYPDIDELLVLGGVLWGDTATPGCLNAVHQHGHIFTMPAWLFGLVGLSLLSRISEST